MNAFNGRSFCHLYKLLRHEEDLRRLLHKYVMQSNISIVGPTDMKLIKNSTEYKSRLNYR